MMGVISSTGARILPVKTDGPGRLSRYRSAVSEIGFQGFAPLPGDSKVNVKDTSITRGAMQKYRE